MATRQQIPVSPRWPTVSTLLTLPNVFGSPTQSSELQVGDTCYVAGVIRRLYVCRVATLGAAVWRRAPGDAPEYVPELSANTQSLYLFDNNLSNAGPINGRDLSAVVGGITYAPFRTGTRRFAQTPPGSRCFAQAVGVWTDPVAPVTIEAVVNAHSIDAVGGSGGILAALQSATGAANEVWSLRVRSDSQVSLSFYDATNTLRELITFGAYVPLEQDVVLHGVIQPTGADTFVAVYCNGMLLASTTFVGALPRSVANQRLAVMGNLDGSASWTTGSGRPLYALHVILEALSAATCLSRSQEILGVV